MQISQEDEPHISHAAFIQITLLLYPDWVVCELGKKKKERNKKEKKNGKERFFKLKLEQQNLFYNLVSLEGKVNLKSTK